MYSTNIFLIFIASPVSYRITAHLMNISALKARQNSFISKESETTRPEQLASLWL